MYIDVIVVEPDKHHFNDHKSDDCGYIVLGMSKISLRTTYLDRKDILSMLEIEEPP